MKRSSKADSSAERTRQVVRWAAAGLSLIMLGGQVCSAETLGGFLDQSKVSGVIRAYDFNRDYGSTITPNQDAFSLGGIVNLKTAKFLGHLHAGVSLFTAHSFGLNNFSDNGAHLDSTLIGKAYSISGLTQAYLAYSDHWFDMKVGDQVINTPWLGASDSRIVPATYQGIYADFKPVDGMNLYALRVFRWKGRTATGYYRDNLYYAPTWSGDQSYGGAGGLGTDAPATQGAVAVGASYGFDGAKLAAWYYGFEQFANMAYIDGSWKIHTGFGFSPYIGAQYVREWKNNSMLNGIKFDGLKPGSGANSLVYGLKFGVATKSLGNLMLGYNDVASKAGAVGGGGIVSPYTANYTTDPLYTSSMIDGLVEQGPGHAWKIKYTKKFMGNHLDFATAFARYHTVFNGNSNNAYGDVQYHFSGMLKGLTLRYRIEDLVFGDKTNNSSGKGITFIYSRIMVQYKF